MRIMHCDFHFHEYCAVNCMPVFDDGRFHCVFELGGVPHIPRIIPAANNVEIIGINVGGVSSAITFDSNKRHQKMSLRLFISLYYNFQFSANLRIIVKKFQYLKDGKSTT